MKSDHVLPERHQVVRIIEVRSITVCGYMDTLKVIHCIPFNPIDSIVERH